MKPYSAICSKWWQKIWKWNKVRCQFAGTYEIDQLTMCVWLSVSEQAGLCQVLTESKQWAVTKSRPRLSGIHHLQLSDYRRDSLIEITVPKIDLNWKTEFYTCFRSTTLLCALTHTFFYMAIHALHAYQGRVCGKVITNSKMSLIMKQACIFAAVKHHN